MSSNNYESKDSLEQRIKEVRNKNAKLKEEIRSFRKFFIDPSASPITVKTFPGYSFRKEDWRKAEILVAKHFRNQNTNVSEAEIKILGERYVLVRGSALSAQLVNYTREIFGDTDSDPLLFTKNLLFDLSHSIGKADSQAMKKLAPDDQSVYRAIGAVHFAFTGWGSVEILPESVALFDAQNSDQSCIICDHHNSFEADSYLKEGMAPMPIPMCFMGCGYSCGWVGEAIGTNLITIEVLCRARGDSTCRFIMASPNKILAKIAEYQANHPELHLHQDNSLPGFIEHRISKDMNELNEQHIALRSEQAKVIALLNNLFPPSVVETMEGGQELIAQTHQKATVLFADIVNFTVITENLDPEMVINWLNSLFNIIDELTEKYQLEKIKTMGDAYMLAGGISLPRPDHLDAILNFALDLIEITRDMRDPAGNPFQMRIGVCTGGPVSSGVIGKKKFLFDIWGDCVNVASRMQTMCDPGKIHCTESVKEGAEEHFIFEDRGFAEVKGKGMLRSYWCIRRKWIN